MVKTLKARKGPSASATNFNLGTKKKGNDGNMWKIGKYKNNVKRWIKISKDKSKTKKRHTRIKLDNDSKNVWGKNKI